jgi:drug/metabolite transporter (DMT)-like permease
VSQRRLIRLAVVTTWVTTGCNFLAFKAALESFPPLTLMSVRLAIAAVVLVTLALLRYEAKPTLKQITNAAVAGVLLLVLGQGSIVWGIQYLPSGQTALFASSAPIFLALFSLLSGERLHGRDLIGIGLGVAGLALLTLGESAGESSNVPAVAIVLAGSAAWAWGSMYSGKADLPADSSASGAIQMLAAIVVIAPLAPLHGELSQVSLDDVSALAVVGVAYLGLIGLALGYSLFHWLDRVTSPLVANTFQYVSPVIALGVGAVVLGERLTILDIGASVILLSSVALMVSRPNATSSSAERGTHHDS